jgi:hypothetical protein
LSISTVLWVERHRKTCWRGSPYGALIDGYDQLHPIHVRFQQEAGDKPAARYQIRHVTAISDAVIVAHIARVVLGEDGSPLPVTSDPKQAFSEMAMYVLVRRGGEWWLAAGQNTPIRAGGAVAATT